MGTPHSPTLFNLIDSCIMQTSGERSFPKIILGFTTCQWWWRSLSCILPWLFCCPILWPIWERALWEPLTRIPKDHVPTCFLQQADLFLGSVSRLCGCCLWDDAFLLGGMERGVQKSQESCKTQETPPPDDGGSAQFWGRQEAQVELSTPWTLQILIPWEVLFGGLPFWDLNHWCSDK